MPSASPRFASRATAALAGSFAAVLLLAGWSTSGEASATPSAPAGARAGATAKILDASGRQLGVLTLTDAGSAISLRGTLRGLAPGVHGIHLHAVGACGGPDFAGAGSQWSPMPTQHGTQNPAGPHHGDLMNLTVGADSSVVVTLKTPAGSLRGEHPLLDADGAAVVVHAAADDYATNPSGGSGARIACGVVSGS